MALTADREQITQLLRDWQAGDRIALDRLIGVVHAELKRLARLHLRHEARGHTLQPTALVNEVYLRLTEIHAMDWRDRAHFFAMASRLMRRTLVDAARAKRADKRGGSAVRVTFDEAHGVAARSDHEIAAQTFDMLALDAVLTRLAVVDERKARVVELRFFGGLNVDATARALGVSVETVARDWRTAKIWLRREMAREARA
jgi:RNA polymerase sigma factor (TIGR02999 family)